MTNISAWLLAGGALSILSALTRLWPLVQRLLWERVSPKLRPWLSTVPAVLGCIAAIIANPAAWLDPVEQLLVVVIPLLAPGALPAGSAHSMRATAAGETRG
jgi:hypothetical protein